MMDTLLAENRQARPAAPASLKYRPDIDGLRALAVLPVVAFHYQLAGRFSGGFIGVDVFFVISGFLISGIIFSDINRGHYSIASFYERRVRRIFPALFVVYLTCILAACVLLFPPEVEEIGKSVLSSLFFVSNVVFYGSAGYFDQSLQQNPLLHTWSLSVEEQFYIAFPLLVFLIRRLEHRIQVAILAAATVVSFGLSWYMVGRDAPQAFYIVPYRAWELLLGSLISTQFIRPVRNVWLADAIGVAGIVAILASIQLLTPDSVFPGPAALAACLGTCAIIYSGGAAKTMTARVLGWQPIRFVGLVSYSLYLWHWPLYVFANHFFELSMGSRYLLALLAFGLSVLSWRFVEKPFRAPRDRASTKTTLEFAGAAMVAIALCAFSAGPAAARIFPISPQTERMLAARSYPFRVPFREGECFIVNPGDGFAAFNAKDCMRLSATKPNVLVFGDSHAAHLWAGLAKAYPNVNFLQATAGGCLPLSGFSDVPRCRDLYNYVMTDFLPHHRVDAVVIAARWRPHTAAIAFGVAKALSRYADKVVLVGPVAEYYPSLPQVLAEASARHEAAEIFAAKHRRSGQSAIDTEFAATHAAAAVRYLSAYKITSGGGCPLIGPDGYPAQFDYGHLTLSGSRCMAGHIGALLFEPAAVGSERRS